MGCCCSAHEEVPRPTPADQLQAQVFIFVNGKSGGNAAQKLLEIGTPSFEFEDKDGLPCKTHLVDIMNAADRASSIEVLKSEVIAGHGDIRVIAAGGDGTVKWVLSLLSGELTGLPVGVIPFGTGNDFSRAVGFGASAPRPLLGKKLSALKKRCRSFLEASVRPLDVWQVSVHIGAGSIKEVKGGKIVETNKGSLVLEEDMVNYFSLGADAQVAFEFEQKRTKSQLGNKLVYVQRGGNQIFNRPKRLRKMVKNLMNENAEEIPFNKRDRVLAFINIPSYSAGANVWSPSKSNGKFREQVVGDGILEACTIRSVTNVGLIHVAPQLKYLVKRTAQERGFRIELVENSSFFFQIDGEAYAGENLSHVEVKHARQVRVLMAPGSLAQSSSLDFDSTGVIPASRMSAKIITRDFGKPTEEGKEEEDDDDDDDDDEIQDEEQEPEAENPAED